MLQSLIPADVDAPVISDALRDQRRSAVALTEVAPVITDRAKPDQTDGAIFSALHLGVRCKPGSASEDQEHRLPTGCHPRRQRAHFSLPRTLVVACRGNHGKPCRDAAGGPGGRSMFLQRRHSPVLDDTVARLPGDTDASPDSHYIDLAQPDPLADGGGLDPKILGCLRDAEAAL